MGVMSASCRYEANLADFGTGRAEEEIKCNVED
jgi:hypothetical protein